MLLESARNSSSAKKTCQEKVTKNTLFDRMNFCFRNYTVKRTKPRLFIMSTNDHFALLTKQSLEGEQ